MILPSVYYFTNILVTLIKHQTSYIIHLRVTHNMLIFRVSNHNPFKRSKTPILEKSLMAARKARKKKGRKHKIHSLFHLVIVLLLFCHLSDDVCSWWFVISLHGTRLCVYRWEWNQHACNCYQLICWIVDIMADCDPDIIHLTIFLLEQSHGPHLTHDWS